MLTQTFRNPAIKACQSITGKPIPSWSVLAILSVALVFSMVSLARASGSIVAGTSGYVSADKTGNGYVDTNTYDWRVDYMGSEIASNSDPLDWNILRDGSSALKITVPSGTTPGTYSAYYEFFQKVEGDNYYGYYYDTTFTVTAP